ncbi:MAG TPA: glycosyltransferase family 4 protein [Verrucomicrobiae bacterium]|nr:glycosyltransferase family 4 protein [Verrucomicrobiae bacterium]
MQKPNSRLRLAFLTHEPFFPPSGGGSAEAVYLVEELVRHGHEVHIFCPQIADTENVAKRFGVQFHEFKKWKMGRYARLRNVKYLAYPYNLERMVVDAANEAKFDLILSQHAISAVAAGKLKKKLKVPVVMNFPDLLTGFMETWPAWVAPRPLIHALERYEISMPVRYGVDGALTVSDTLADLFAERGFARDRIQPIYYGYDSDKFPFLARTVDKPRPPVVVMHGSFDAHHLGDIALNAIRYVTKQKPGTVFRFVGRETVSLQAFLRKAQSEISGFKFETTGFVSYVDVAKHLADANVGMVPYEESAGTHCAFVAKVVEYVAIGLPSVCTPLKSIQRYFQNEPMIRFAKFNGEDFGRKIVSWLEESPLNWQIDACNSAARVQAELDWQPLCRKAVNFVEEIYARSSK